MNRKEFITHIRKLRTRSRPVGRGGFSNWLDSQLETTQMKYLRTRLADKFSAQELYDHLFPKARRTCKSPECNKSVRFDKEILAYKKYCSPACSWKDPRTIALRAANELMRSGGLYTNVAQRPNIREQHSSLLKTDEYKQGIRNRELARSGGTCSDPRGRPEAVAKRVASHRASELRRSGGTRTNSSQRKHVRSKISKTVSGDKCQVRTRKTILSATNGKYTSYMQDPEFLKRVQIKARQRYRVRYASNSWLVQGYEDAALRYLVDSGIPADCITDDCPSVFYEGKSKHGPSGYTPDLGIGNLLLEIKSEFTIRKNAEAEIDNHIILKAQGVLESGYPFLLLLFGRAKGKKPSMANKYTPRRSELIGYIYATPEKPNFKMRTKFNKLKSIIRSYI